MSLVTILDADKKEGSLRNRRSLIQTMGRAAKAPGFGHYVCRSYNSMRIAIGETQRRRKLQSLQHKHGIRSADDS